MTNDIISRQAAIDVILADKIDNKSLKVMDALGNGNEAKTLNMTCDRHAELLKSLPSAQPEIIRCCECKHHHRDKSGAYYCGRRKEYGYGWGMNDFCSDAERKEN